MRRWAGSGLVDSGKVQDTAGNFRWQPLNPFCTALVLVFGLRMSWCVGCTGIDIPCLRFLITGS